MREFGIISIILFQLCLFLKDSHEGDQFMKDQTKLENRLYKTARVHLLDHVVIAT